MVKPKSFRTWNPEQTLLLPPSPVDWLPENHLVFFLLDLAGELDLEEIHAVYRQKDPRGEKAYEPRMMVVLLLYAYCVGLPRSRRPAGKTPPSGYSPAISSLTTAGSATFAGVTWVLWTACSFRCSGCARRQGW